MSASCGSAEHSLRNAYPLYEALYYEAKGLAETEEQKQDVEWLRYVAAWAWVSPPSSSDSDKRENEIQLFLKDNLQ